MNTPTSSGGFSFGQNTGSTSSSFSFGQPAQTPSMAVVNPSPASGGFSFGSNMSSTPKPTSLAFGFTGSTFGQSASSSGASTFGITQPVASGFGAGLTQTPSVTGGLGLGQPTASGFNLGQATSTSQTTGFSLGLSAATPSGVGIISKPMPLAPTGGFGLGQVTTSQTPGFTLGQPATSVATGFGLGQPTSSIQTGGLNFGQPSTTPLTGGFNIGQQVPTSQSGPLNFTNPTSTAQTGIFNLSKPITTTQTSGFTLGQPIATSTPTGFNVGTPAITSGLSTGFSLGTPAVTSGLSTGFLGAPAVTSGLSTGFLGAPAVTSGPPTTGFNLGQPATTTSTTSTGFNLLQPVVSTSAPVGLALGQSVTASPQPSGFNFQSTPSSGQFSAANPLLTSSSFGTTSLTFTTTSGSVGLGGTTPAMAVSGLGGVQIPSNEAGQGGSISKVEGKSAKETPLPQDIFATIAAFEIAKDTEKKASEENIRQSATPFHKLGDDAKKLKQHIIKLSNQHAQLHSNAAKLKSSVIQEAANVEMARRTQDTPMSLQGANKAPEEFFLRLVRSFEERKTYCRTKIDEVERCSRINGGVPDATPEDIMEVLKREHETVKMLAARVYALHTTLLDQYQKSGRKVQPTPEVLFKPCTPAEPKTTGYRMESSVLRPCLGEISSGLFNFQSGQQRAKAVSLGAAPPTMPLGQSTSSFILGSGQTSLFNSTNTLGGSSPFNLGTNTSNTNFNLGNKSPSLFGSGNTNSFSSPFGTSLQPSQPSGGLFGSSFSNSSFGMKPFGK